jgi:hypothetical protein
MTCALQRMHLLYIESRKDLDPMKLINNASIMWRPFIGENWMYIDSPLKIISISLQQGGVFDACHVLLIAWLKPMFNVGHLVN